MMTVSKKYTFPQRYCSTKINDLSVLRSACDFAGAARPPSAAPNTLVSITSYPCREQRKSVNTAPRVCEMVLKTHFESRRMILEVKEPAGAAAGEISFHRSDPRSSTCSRPPPPLIQSTWSICRRRCLVRPRPQ